MESAIQFIHNLKLEDLKLDQGELELYQQVDSTEQMIQEVDLLGVNEGINTMTDTDEVAQIAVTPNFLEQLNHVQFPTNHDTNAHKQHVETQTELQTPYLSSLESENQSMMAQLVLIKESLHKVT